MRHKYLFIFLRGEGFELRMNQLRGRQGQNRDDIHSLQGVRKWHLGFRMGEGRLANSIGLNCNSLLGPNDMSQLFSHHILHPMGPMPKRILCGAFLSQLIKTRVMNLPNSVRRNLHLQYECGQIGAHKKRNSARPISCLRAAQAAWGQLQTLATHILLCRLSACHLYFASRCDVCIILLYTPTSNQCNGDGVTRRLCVLTFISAST